MIGEISGPRLGQDECDDSEPYMKKNITEKKTLLRGNGLPWDVVIYGGTCAGIIAAVQVARMGKSVVVIEPERRIGGMTTGGLGDTDAGIEASIGGLALEFYQRVGTKYGSPRPEWFFEPKVALDVFRELVNAHHIPVLYSARLDPVRGVEKSGARILSLRMESGAVFTGKMFIDATYEGDLMAAAGVSFVTGRENNALYGETQNGIRSETELPSGIDPYVVPGDPASGLLARVNAVPGGETGDGDPKLQAYNFRMCLTDDPENRLPVWKPTGYREEDYEILFRAIAAGQTRRFFKLRMLPNRKSDSNNDSGISTDYIGMNHDYVGASYAERERLREAHRTYQTGLVWTVQNHPRVPKEIRDFYAPWGLPRDEFTESGHWPEQIYIREARRMRSDYVITEHVARREQTPDDPIGLGSYAMDSHHTQYCVGQDGFLRTEGGFYIPLDEPYPISYRAILPRAYECNNLVVPVCVSATHAAYGSVRMEPVFMILGQSAATAACLAIDAGETVQNLDYGSLRNRLLGDGQILEWSKKKVETPIAEPVPGLMTATT